MNVKRYHPLTIVACVVIGLFGVWMLNVCVPRAQTVHAIEPEDVQPVANETAHLSITKDVTPTFVTEVNAPITYTVTFTNDGDVHLTNVVITDELSTSVGYGYALSPECSGPSGGVGGTVSCDVGMLPTGGSESVQFVILAAIPGVITNIAEADADQLTPVQSETVAFYYSAGCVHPYGLDFTTAPQQPIAGEPVVFTASFNEHTFRPLYYDWNLDGVGGPDRGGYESAGNPVTYTYAVSGTYHVQLDIANGCGVNTYYEDVVVLGEPELAWTPESIQHTSKANRQVITPVLTLTNTGTANLHWTVEVSPATTGWLRLMTGSGVSTTTRSGTTVPSGRETITGGFDTTGLTTAVYTAQLFITSDAATVTVPVTLTVNDDLMAHYPFDGNADDASGNDNHGTTYGVTLTRGYRGDADGAYHFDGEDDYILVPDSDTLDLTTEATFALWVNVDPEINYGVYGSPHLFSKGATHGNLWADYALKMNQNHARFEITDDVNSPQNAHFPSIPEGRWVHLAVVYRNSTVTLYQDGLVVTEPISTHGAIRASDQPLYIGHRYLTKHAGRFEGAIDDLRIYNRALSDAEIASLAGLMAYYPFDGNADDASGQGNHGTAHGATLTPDRQGTADSAYHFDGVNDYILVPDSDTLDLTTSATFALCVNVDPEIDYGVYGSPHFFSKGATHGALWADYAFKLNENRSLFESTTGTNSPRNAILPAIPEGEWVHVAVVYRDGMVTLYQDGITVTQPVTAQAAIRVSDQPLYIGHRYEDLNAGRFEGMLDNLRIYNRALSAGEIGKLTWVDCSRRVYLPLVVR